MRLKDPRVLWPLGEGPAVVGAGKSGGRMNVPSLAGIGVRPPQPSSLSGPGSKSKGWCPGDTGWKDSVSGSTGLSMTL